MPKAEPDDLEALRAIVAALRDFDRQNQERLIRWAREKLGLNGAPERTAARPAPAPEAAAGRGGATGATGAALRSQDIRTFIEAKNPQTDRQFAAAVAYYYRFEAPEAQRKVAITAGDLQDACRQAGRTRIRHLAQTLVNAHHQGYLDKTADRGQYALSTVGENLVAMTLPQGAEAAPRARSNRLPRRSEKPTRKTRKKKK